MVVCASQRIGQALRCAHNVVMEPEPTATTNGEHRRSTFLSRAIFDTRRAEFSFHTTTSDYPFGILDKHIALIMLFGGDDFGVNNLFWITSTNY